MADCALARKGRPPAISGFQSGRCGSSARVCCRNGWNTSVESASSKFDPSPGTRSGRSSSHGTLLKSRSEPDSVQPGTSDGATIRTESTA